MCGSLDVQFTTDPSQAHGYQSFKDFTAYKILFLGGGSRHWEISLALGNQPGNGGSPSCTHTAGQTDTQTDRNKKHPKIHFTWRKVGSRMDQNDQKVSMNHASRKRTLAQGFRPSWTLFFRSPKVPKGTEGPPSGQSMITFCRICT